MRIFLRQFFNMSKKISYPSAERNKNPILQVLQEYIKKEDKGHCLEISSGTGQHLAHFAVHFPNVTFQPSEYDASLFESIKTYARETDTKNVKDPIRIDVTTNFNGWKLEVPQYDYMINVNMMHISPYECTLGLFRNAGSLLKQNGLLITYGPYAKDGVITPQSNVDFDKNLKRQNPEWGLRDINDLEKIANKNGITLIKIHDMPANNKCLIWKKVQQH